MQLDPTLLWKFSHFNIRKIGSCFTRSLKLTLRVMGLVGAEALLYRLRLELDLLTVKPLEVLPAGDKYFSFIFRLVRPFTVGDTTEGFYRKWQNFSLFIDTPIIIVSQHVDINKTKVISHTLC